MKDKIGNVVRALVAVPQEYLGILLDLAIKLGGKDGSFWYQRLVAVSKVMMESAGEVFNTIIVASGLALTERISLGSYDWVNGDINEKRFPHDATTIGEWEWKLVHLNRDISSDDAKLAVEVDGFTCAKVEHLLAFGEAFPEEQRKYPIVALGSVCEVHGARRVLALWRDDSKRSLDLHWWDGDWCSGYRFLVVRKKNSST